MKNDLDYLVVSPDGRFEVSRVDTTDRYTFTCDTVLIERATGEWLFSCQGAVEADFSANGLLRIHYPAYSREGLLLDPARRLFRTRESDPWVPLAAWPMVETAYGRGWSQAMEYRRNDPQTEFPWMPIGMLCASVAALPIIAVVPFRLEFVRLVFLSTAGLAVLLFGWLTSVGFQSWTNGRKWARILNAEGRLSQLGRHEEKP